MNNLHKQLKQHIESAPLVMPMHQAPDLAEHIWHSHQTRKKRQWLVTAAGIGMLMVTSVMQLNALSESPLLNQNHQLERQLASMSGVMLSEQQRLVMADWQHELSLIDQSIEQQQSAALVDQKAWALRSNILSKMVEFYIHPSEVYEL
ncbi:MAG: hypothetical protein ACI8WB_003977 [Phenylobacterium sp.]|jgi:hypothetical protein